MSERKISDLPWAEIWHGMNEWKIRAKSVNQVGAQAGDAIGLRFQVPVENLEGSGYLACFFADVLSGRDADGPTERVQLKLAFKLDPGPCLELYATRPGGSDDGDEVRIFRFALDGVEFDVPVKGIGGGGGQYLEKFAHDAASGRTLMYNPQSDAAWPLGVIVVYDVTSGPPKAVGKIPVQPL